MKLRHVGMVVNKNYFDETIEFYKILGFVFSHGKVEDGDYIDNFFKVKGLQIMTWKMSNEFDDCIELIRFENTTPYKDEKSKHYTPLCFVGLTHIAIQVEDLEKIKEKLVKQGISLECDIQHTPAGLRSACDVLFCRDPNGVFVELVEEKKE